MARVILWSSHRCLSTVFERSILELPGVKVVHEPLSSTLFEDDIRVKEDADSLFEDKRNLILQQCQGEEYEHIFVKDMGYAISGRYNEYVEGDFADFKHTFLIRHPMNVALSLQRVLSKLGTSCHTKSLGFEDLYNTYETVKSIDANPVVISAEDLLKNPREMMQMYCGETGLPFSESMLSWEPKTLGEWDQSPAWYQGVMRSTGFTKATEKSAPAVSADHLPPEFQEAVKEALPFYEKLRSVRKLPISLSKL